VPAVFVNWILYDDGCVPYGELLITENPEVEDIVDCSSSNRSLVDARDGHEYVNVTVNVPVDVEGADIVGADTAETVKVTEIVLGLLLATVDATETVAVYVPAALDPVVACSVTVAGAVVVFSVAVNHPAPEL
jgi:hypothetical protein